MNRTVRVLIILLLLSALLPLGAEESKGEILWGSNYRFGNFIPSLAVAGELEEAGEGITIGIYPAAEIILYKPTFGKSAFFDFGLEAGGRLGIPLRESDLTAGAYLAGTFHFGLRGLDFPGSEIMDRLDFFSRIGLGVDIVAPQSPSFGLAFSSGLNFFIDESLKIGLAYSDWHEYSGVSLNIGYRLGRRSEVKGMGTVWDEGGKAISSVQESIHLAHFYSLMLFSFYSGGYFWAPESWEAGSGTLWKYSDGEEHFFVERILVSDNPDSGSWWRLRFYNDTEEMLYEFNLDSQYNLVTLLYRDSSGAQQRYEYREGTESRAEVEARSVENFETILTLAETNSREDVVTGAGTFPGAVVVTESDESSTSTWWFTLDDEVPGRLIRYRIEDEEGTLEGRLEKIIAGGTL